jgi:TPR repeat protein
MAFPPELIGGPKIDEVPDVPTVPAEQPEDTPVASGPAVQAGVGDKPGQGAIASQASQAVEKTVALVEYSPGQHKQSRSQTRGTQTELVYVDPTTVPAQNASSNVANGRSGVAALAGDWVERPAAPAASDRETSVKQPARAKQQVRSAALAPEPQVPGTAPGDHGAALIERGDQLLLLGDIVAARQVYEYAMHKGSRDAASRIATTYDPRIFSKLGVHGLKPDLRKALQWYEKAALSGDEKAQKALQNLQTLSR